MTNSLAILMGAVIVGLLAVDFVYFDNANLLFLAKKFLELLNWVAFWR